MAGNENTASEGGYGNFGNLSNNYAEARRDFPQEVIEWLWQLIGSRDAEVLDLGCGTGISTRQIAEGDGTVVGCDKDGQMIRRAREAGDDLEYYIAPAETLPFDGEAFNAVTAFSAFHWFANDKAIEEIQRVLKPGGVFFVVNKNDVGNFKRGYKDIIRRVTKQELPAAKKGYNPKDLLREAGFSEAEERNYPASEYFTLKQAVAYLQSVSVWNLVPRERKDDALKLLEDYCRRNMNDEGHIERKLTVKAVAAHY